MVIVVLLLLLVHASCEPRGNLASIAGHYCSVRTPPDIYLISQPFSMYHFSDNDIVSSFIQTQVSDKCRSSKVALQQLAVCCCRGTAALAAP